MADVFSKEKRSEVMRLIKSKNTKPEILVRSFLHSKGLRFRLHSGSLPGKPDIILKKYHTVIFVHGCFWHGHESETCKISRMPKSNIEFWEKKIEYNRKRHVKNATSLMELGWRVLIIWECKLKNSSKTNILDNLFYKVINSSSAD